MPGKAAEHVDSHSDSDADEPDGLTQYRGLGAAGDRTILFSVAALECLAALAADQESDYLTVVATVYALLNRNNESIAYLEQALDAPLHPMYGKIDLIRFTVDP